MTKSASGVLAWPSKDTDPVEISLKIFVAFRVRGILRNRPSEPGVQWLSPVLGKGIDFLLKTCQNSESVLYCGEGNAMPLEIFYQKLLNPPKPWVVSKV